MKQVNWTRQLGLATFLFVLGTGAYWLEFKHKPDQEDREEQEKKIFLLKGQPVQSIQLLDGDLRYTFNCTDIENKLCKPRDVSKWEMSQPSKIRGDDSNLNHLLTSLSNLSPNETIDLKSETPEKQQVLLKEYGLDSESRTKNRKIEVITPKGKSVLYLGQVHPIGGHVYGVLEKTTSDGKTELNENLVFLVPSHVKTIFEHDLTYWRNKKLLTVAAHEVTGFDLQGPKGYFKAKRVKGLWTLASGGEKEIPGDIEAIDAMLTGATYLVAKNFIAENKNEPKAQEALKGFTRLVDLTLEKDASNIQLTLFKKDKKGPKPTDPVLATVYATVSNLDPLFELDSYAKERINKSLKELRLAKLISSMDRFSAKKMEFSGQPLGSSPLVLENKDGKWKTTHAKDSIAGEKLQDILEKLSGNRIQDFFTGRDIPEGEEAGLKFTLHGEKDAIQRQFVFWKKGEKLYGKDLLGRRDEAFLLDSSIQAALPWDKDFFSKKIEPQTPSKSDKTEE